MRRRLPVLLVLSAWFLATGAQWDLAQVFAWGRMFAGYSQEMTVNAALEKTFSGEMCAICRAVQKGRHEQERNSPATPDAKAPGKILNVIPLAFAPRISAPPVQRVSFVAADDVMLGEGRSSPPIPPPREIA